ncbi:MAG: hypothetical protein ACKO34_00140 [Vampirovibrionales bacterium]
MNDVNLLRQRLQQGLPSAPSLMRPAAPSSALLSPTVEAYRGSTPTALPPTADQALKVARPSVPEVVQRAERLPSTAITKTSDGVASSQADASSTKATAERAAVVPPTPQRIPLPYQDIKRIAEASGFVGMSDRAIEQAYRQGKSLMVDYRV